jgi:transposase InsO family protein
VTAKYPNHVWHVDLTVMPTAMGFCCSWLPLALPQRWPFCYWLAVAVDHFSRRAMGCIAMKENPTSERVRAFLGRAMAKAKATPKYIICDRGQQFDCSGFRDWCRRKGIQPPRYGAVGKHGSIAVIERLNLTLKTLLSALLLIPYSRNAFQREVDAVVEWYNRHRPHTRLQGRTPDEVYHGRFAANRKPRLEPRSRWPRHSPCARPWALVRGSPGTRLELNVKFLHGRRHLPLVTLVRAA